MKTSQIFVTAMTILGSQLPLSAQQSCVSLAQLADQAVLEETAGSNPAMQMMTGLPSDTTDSLSHLFDVRVVASITGERFRAAHSCPRRREREAAPERFECRYSGRSDQRISLDVDMREGEVDYINPTRRFDRQGPDNAIQPAEAIATAVAAATALGAPPSEIAGARATTRNRILVSKVRSENVPVTVRRTEVFVRIPREMNGFVVHGSDARVAIDVAGRAARAHLVWPDFTLGAEPANVRALTQAEIVQRIVEEVGSFSHCGWAGEIIAHVGWIEGTVGQDGPVNGRYIPGVRIAVSAPENLPPPRAPWSVHIIDIPLIIATNSDT